MKTRTARRHLTIAGVAGASILTNAVAGPATAAPAPSPEPGAGARSVRDTIRHHRNARAALRDRTRRLTDRATDPVVRDRLRRYLDEAAQRGRLLGTDDVEATTTDAGAVVVSRAEVELEAIEERVAVDGGGTVNGYAFQASSADHGTRPAAAPVRPPGLGYDGTIIYTLPATKLYAPGVELSDNMNVAEWGGEVYQMTDEVDKSADFFSYRRWTVGKPQRGSGPLIGFGVTGLKAEAGIPADWMPWFLGRGPMEPAETKIGECKEYPMTVVLFGGAFEIGAPGFTFCEVVEPINYPLADQMSGVNYNPGFEYATDNTREVGFNQLVKFAPGPWPVWNDYTFASFCRTSFLDCEDMEKPFDDKKATP